MLNIDWMVFLMTWSHWFVTPAITSLFFLLGVLTLYWYLTNRIIRWFKTRGKHPNEDKVRTDVGLVYMVVLNVGVQLAVNHTPYSWAFTNFQIFAIVFVSYFLMLEIKFWQLALAILLFMVVNQTLGLGLAWVFAVVFIAYFYVMKFVRSRRHHVARLHRIHDCLVAALRDSRGVVGQRRLSSSTMMWELI